MLHRLNDLLEPPMGLTVAVDVKSMRYPRGGYIYIYIYVYVIIIIIIL